MGTEDSLRQEQALLRSELQHLKQCQLQYFLVSVTATGAITSLNSAVFAGDTKVPPLMYLAPLLIVIPCWWTFFDKATTITRLVGYLRVLERALQHPAVARYCGYEEALSMFRRREDALRASSTSSRDPGQVWRVLTLRTRYRYWMVNWYTFFVLSMVCCLLPLAFGVSWSARSDPRVLVVWMAVLVVAVSGYSLARVLFSLVSGERSFDAVAEFWKQVWPESHEDERA